MVNKTIGQIKAINASFLMKDFVEGPISRKKASHARIVYVLFFIVGLLPTLLNKLPFLPTTGAVSPLLQTLGLGLIVPGGGFLALGPWGILGFLLTLILVMAAMVLWFGSGNLSAAPLVWLVSAVIAGAMAGHGVWTPGPYIAVGCIGLYFIRGARTKNKLLKKHLAKRDERLGYVPEELAQVRQTAQPEPAAGSLELSREQLLFQRVLFDEALQPFGQFKGYDDPDIFQFAAIRYQMNQVQNTLNNIFYHYTPNFHGYAAEAQRKMVEHYTHRHVWDYWRLENFWGNHRIGADPVAEESNIMLTGWYGNNIALYMKNTGDMRYAEPGSVVFRLNKKKAFDHSLHTITNNIVENWKKAPYFLYPCEPDMLYPLCNWKAVQSVVAYDSLFGTTHMAELIDRFTTHYIDEFVPPSGTLPFFISKAFGWNSMRLTGDLFLYDELMVPLYNTILPHLAEEAYTFIRHDYFKRQDGRLVVRPEMKIEKQMDTGNYKQGCGSSLGGLLLAASEMGDAEAVAAVTEALNTHVGYQAEGGALRWKCSNQAHATITQAVTNFRNAWRTVNVSNPLFKTNRGPVLSEASYPEVLVAKAWSDGRALDLVFYPGGEDGLQRITVSRLKPNAPYCIKGPQEKTIQADELGCLSVVVALAGRTPVRIVPVD